MNLYKYYVSVEERYIGRIESAIEDLIDNEHIITNKNIVLYKISMFFKKCSIEKGVY